MDPKDDMLVAAHPASRDFAPPMTEKNNVAPDGLVPTPTECEHPRRFSDIATVGDAPDYAAHGNRWPHFHDTGGRLAPPTSDREPRNALLLATTRMIPPATPPVVRNPLLS